MHKKLGLSKHAFSLDARKTVDELVKDEEHARDLLYWVESESIVLLKGPVNSGKTRLAFEVVENYKGEGRVVYLDLDTYNRDVDIGHLLIANQSFLRRFFNKMPRDMILILDNISELSDDFFKRVQYYFDQGYIKSVVLVKKDGVDLSLPDSVWSRIGNKVIELKAFSKAEALELAGDRLGKYFNKNQLELLWKHSGDLESLFGVAELVLEEYLRLGKKKLDVKFIEKVLK